MSAPSRRAPFVSGAHSWVEKSGFSDAADSGPWSYARRISQYISNPSVARVRTLDAYGRAPSVEDIAKMRAEWLASVKARRTAEWIEAEDDLKPRNNNAIAPAKTEDSFITKVRIIAPEIVTAPPVADKPKPKPMMHQPLRTRAEVIAAVAHEFDITPDDITGHRRFLSITKPRMLVATILYARGNSYPEVGRRLNRDHSTIIHAVEQFFGSLIKRPDMLNAWMRFAPCGARLCQTADELRAYCKDRYK